MSPLNKRIAYKKKNKSPIARYIFIIALVSLIAYFLFYHRFDGKTVYERVVGFFKSEIEKSPSISIVNADKEVKKFFKNEPKNNNIPSIKESGDKSSNEGDEIEEVIKKKLKGK